MLDWVRVQEPDTKAEVTVTRDQVAFMDGVKVLQKDAVDSVGRPLPPKYYRTVDEAAAANRKGA